jgi:hypothetical protein
LHSSLTHQPNPKRSPSGEVKEFPAPVAGGKVVVSGRYARSYDATGKLIAISFKPSGQAQAMTAASTPALTPSAIATIPNMDRVPVGSDAKSLTEQMQKCLEYSVTKRFRFGAGLDGMGSSDGQGLISYAVTEVSVHVHNSCNTTFLASDSWFEAKAFEKNGDGNTVVAREVGRFHNSIPSMGTATTVIDLQCEPTKDYRFAANVWWAAGGGRKPGE